MKRVSCSSGVNLAVILRGTQGGSRRLGWDEGLGVEGTHCQKKNEFSLEIASFVHSDF